MTVECPLSSDIIETITNIVVTALPRVFSCAIVMAVMSSYIKIVYYCYSSRVGLCVEKYSSRTAETWDIDFRWDGGRLFRNPYATAVLLLERHVVTDFSAVSRIGTRPVFVVDECTNERPFSREFSHSAHIERKPCRPSFPRAHACVFDRTGLDFEHVGTSPKSPVRTTGGRHRSTYRCVSAMAHPRKTAYGVVSLRVHRRKRIETETTREKPRPFVSRTQNVIEYAIVTTVVGLACSPRARFERFSSTETAFLRELLRDHTAGRDAESIHFSRIQESRRYSQKRAGEGEDFSVEIVHRIRVQPSFFVIR